MSPFLFVLILDCILHEALNEDDGWTIHGKATPKQQATTTMQLRPKKTRSLHTSIPYLAFADDLCMLTRNAEAAERQLYSLQTVARTCGLEINVGRNKTEVNFYDCSGVVKTVDGKVLTSNNDYAYLGTLPQNPEAAFLVRLRKAWAAIKKLDPVWKCGVKVQTKLRLVNALVVAVFLSVRSCGLERLLFDVEST